jgi:hypothetical protein
LLTGAVPTAFRGKNLEDLLPTLAQLKQTQPNVAVFWFERGRMWASQEEARAELNQRRATPRNREPQVHVAARRRSRGSAREVSDLARRETRAVQAPAIRAPRRRAGSA